MPKQHTKPEIKLTDPPARLGMRQALDRIIFRARHNWLTALLTPGGCWLCYSVRIMLIVLIITVLSTML